MQPRDKQRLEHIAEYCDDIAQTIVRFGDDHKTFCADKAYHDLICFYLLQIGELAGQLSPEMRASSAGSMNWNQIKGMRNVVACTIWQERNDLKFLLQNDPPFCITPLQQTFA